MSKKTILKCFSFLLCLSLLFGSVATSGIQAATPKQGLPSEEKAPQQNRPATVDSKVQETLQTTGEANYWINFKAAPDLSAAQTMNWEDRGWFVYETLKAHAETTQQAAITTLQNAGVKFQSYWVNNAILVDSSNAQTLSAIQDLEGVESITARKSYQLYRPVKTESTGNELHAVEPNISQIKAPQAWALGIKGEGIVVANIDTGVRYSHDALKNQYRGNNGDGTYSHDYNWLDPTNNSTNVPADPDGHGTHTMGTAVGADASGTNQIGVAPASKWMACNGCTVEDCPDYALISCGQFMAAPTKTDGSNADPSKRPHVVNNSWGDCSQVYDPFYESVLTAWEAAGIYPAFANGNSSNCGYDAPPGLNTVGSPARSGKVTGVGSSQQTGAIYAQHSNWGPTDNLDTINPRGFADLKPQVVAPVTGIRSAGKSGDSNYEAGWSGTSMSTPHVSGVVALVWNACPLLIGDYALTETILEQTAVAMPYDDGHPTTPASKVPNMATGWGEVDALAAVNRAKAICEGPKVKGLVSNSQTNAPLAEATLKFVHTQNPDLNRTVKSISDGTYVAPMVAGTYDITVSKFGYFDAVKPGFVVEAGSSDIVLDFKLDPRVNVLLMGKVTDAGLSSDQAHGIPVYASLSFEATGSQPQVVFSNPFTGRYEAILMVGVDYTITVKSVYFGYEPQTAELTAMENQADKDFALAVDKDFCAAPGYAHGNAVYFDFEGSDHGFTSGGTNSSWAWGDFTSGPGYALSGTKGIATNPAGNYNTTEDSWMVSPKIDLSAYGTKTPVLHFAHWLYTEGEHDLWDWVWVEATRDGGANWEKITTDLVGHFTDYQHRSIPLDARYNVTDFQFRFQLHSDSIGPALGWYIDNIGISMLDLAPSTVVAFETFETSNGGFTVSGENASWEYGDVNADYGPGNAYSGTKLWATKIAGNHNDNENSYLTSPAYDLSKAEYQGKLITLSFYHWMDTELNFSDWGAVEVSKDGGAHWQTVYEKFGNIHAWAEKQIELDSSYLVNNFKVRFLMHSDSARNWEGWYIDDFKISVGESQQADLGCQKLTGGFLAGYVMDAETPIALVGARVESQAGVLAISRGFEDDPTQNGFYLLFHSLETNPQTVKFTASHTGYPNKVKTVSMPFSTLTRQDFFMGGDDPEPVEQYIYFPIILTK